MSKDWKYTIQLLGITAVVTIIVSTIVLLKSFYPFNLLILLQFWLLMGSLWIPKPILRMILIVPLVVSLAGTVGFMYFCMAFAQGEYAGDAYFERQRQLFHQIADNPKAQWIQFAEHENYIFFYDTHSINRKTPNEECAVLGNTCKELKADLGVWMKWYDSLRKETEVKEIFFNCNNRVYHSGRSFDLEDKKGQNIPRHEYKEPWVFDFIAGGWKSVPDTSPVYRLFNAVCISKS